MAFARICRLVDLARDQSRDAVRRQRRQRLRDMLAHAHVPADGEVSVLDVGGGYGVVTEEVLAAFPHARVTLQDYSEPMLDAARRRLAPEAGRLAFVQADLTDPGWTGRVGGPFDLAVSAIAIHNLRDIGAIADCYRGIAQVLKPGAPGFSITICFSTMTSAASSIMSSCCKNPGSPASTACGGSRRWRRSPRTNRLPDIYFPNQAVMSK